MIDDYRRGYVHAKTDVRLLKLYLMVSYTADTDYGHGYHDGVVDAQREIYENHQDYQRWAGL